MNVKVFLNLNDYLLFNLKEILFNKTRVKLLKKSFKYI